MMRQLAVTFAVLSIAFFNGCDRAPTHDSVMEDSVTVMEDLAKVMATVKDEASAAAAKPKLKELSDKMKTLKAESDKMAKPSKEKEDELKKKYEDRMTKAMTSLFGESMRIGMDPKLKSVLSDIEGLGK